MRPLTGSIHGLQEQTKDLCSPVSLFRVVVDAAEADVDTVYLEFVQCVSKSRQASTDPFLTWARPSKLLFLSLRTSSFFSLMR